MDGVHGSCFCCKHLSLKKSLAMIDFPAGLSYYYRGAHETRFMKANILQLNNNQ